MARSKASGFYMFISDKMKHSLSSEERLLFWPSTLKKKKRTFCLFQLKQIQSALIHFLRYVQAAFTHIRKGQNEFGNLSSREQSRTSYKAKHSLVFCQTRALAVIFHQEVYLTRVKTGHVNEKLHLCPGHKCL